jgi:DNA-binding CsgD family transcriptional regulator
MNHIKEQTAPAASVQLTAKEHEVLHWAARGKSARCGH